MASYILTIIKDLAWRTFIPTASSKIPIIGVAKTNFATLEKIKDNF
jgi:hypothetical protein